MPASNSVQVITFAHPEKGIEAILVRGALADDRRGRAFASALDVCPEHATWIREVHKTGGDFTKANGDVWIINSDSAYELALQCEA